jgi:hypothetical protein
MPKNQIKLFIIYAVLMILLTQFLQHSLKYHHLLEPCSAFFGAWLPIGLAIFGIQNGWVVGKFCMIARDESPVSYWLLIALGFLSGFYLIYRGVLDFFR